MNDIAGILPDVKLFAEDVKLYSCYNATADNDDLDEAISRLIDWSKNWQMCIANEKYLSLRIRIKIIIIYNARWKTIPNVNVI